MIDLLLGNGQLCTDLGGDWSILFISDCTMSTSECSLKMEEDWRKQTEEKLSTWGYAPSISIEKNDDGEVPQMDQDGYEGSCNSGFSGVSSSISVLHEER